MSNTQTVKTAPWDAADFLDSPEAIAAYLDAAVEEARDEPGRLSIRLPGLGQTAPDRVLGRTPGTRIWCRSLRAWESAGSPQNLQLPQTAPTCQTEKRLVKCGLPTWPT